MGRSRRRSCTEGALRGSSRIRESDIKIEVSPEPGRRLFFGELWGLRAPWATPEHDPATGRPEKPLASSHRRGGSGQRFQNRGRQLGDDRGVPGAARRAARHSTGRRREVGDSGITRRGHCGFQGPQLGVERRTGDPEQPCGAITIALSGAHRRPDGEALHLGQVEHGSGCRWSIWARRQAGRARGAQEAVDRAEPHELGGRAYPEPLVHLGTVRLHRLQADPEGTGDVGVPRAVERPLEDVPLLRCEPGENVVG